jgi:hypothetical protein
MNKLTLLMAVLSMLFTAGCTTNGISTGGSYTDESVATPALEVSTSESNLSDPSAELPDIAAYDEPEIPALDAPATE